MDLARDLATPTLLVAMPQVLDPFFNRSVLLLIHHDDEGSMGFILNRPTGFLVHDILEGMEIPWEGDPEIVAHFGGPVQPQIGSILFRSEEIEGGISETSSEILPDTGISQHIGDLERLAAAPPGSFRLFLGHAGWSPGQLMDEILRNDWLTAPVDRRLIFELDSDQIWEAALRSVGVDPAHLPSWTPGSDADSAN